MEKSDRERERKRERKKRKRKKEREREIEEEFFDKSTHEWRVLLSDLVNEREREKKLLSMEE